MFNPDAKRLLDMYLNVARETDREATAEANLAYAAGMIGYAAACGDLSPTEHTAHWDLIRLVQAERDASRQVAPCAA